MSGTQILIGNVPLENFIIFTAATIVVIFLSYLCYKTVSVVLTRLYSRSVARWTARVVGYIIFGIGLYYCDLAFLGFDVSATFASLGILRYQLSRLLPSRSSQTCSPGSSLPLIIPLSLTIG